MTQLEGIHNIKFCILGTVMHDYIFLVDPGGPVVTYSPLDPRFADSNPAGVDGFFF